jgi:type I restriction enzyme S subunit
VTRVRLKDVALVRPSNVDKVARDDQPAVRLCNYTDVYYGDRLRNEADYMPSTATDEQIRRFCLKPGDTVITKDSETPDDIGVSAYVESSDYDLLCGYHLAILRPGPDVHPRYLTWAVRGDDARGQLATAATGVTRYGLRMEALAKLELWVPDRTQQATIALMLDVQVAHIDELLALRTRQIDALNARRSSNALIAVTGADRMDAMGGRLLWASAVPASWPIAKITHAARLGSGHTPSRGHPEWWLDCTLPWITTGEVQQIRDDRTETLDDTREGISWIGHANSSAEVRPAGTVVLSRTASAGYSAVMGRPMATSQDFVTWTCGPGLDPYYLLWCLRAMRPDLLGRLAMGSTHKTIYMPDIHSLQIPLPPIEEQHRIVAALRAENTRIDQGVDRMRSHAALLKERRQALITNAVLGRLPTAQEAAA